MQTITNDGLQSACKRITASLLVAAGLGGATALAQSPEERVVSDPPPLRADPQITTKHALAAGKAAAEPTETALNLNVVFTTGKLWNPATRRFDTVKLRSYQGREVDPDRPFISPLLTMSPGETLRITLNNQLPKEASCTDHVHDVNEPHCANGTNLHTHGLWVNPAGNSDNVLISVNPGVSFTYEYHIPSDHPAGTFWYHTHKHGSTALQVSSGMAGTLIVRGDRLPSPSRPGDLDTLLRPIPGQPFRERVALFQQIQYACRDPKTSEIKLAADGSYQCDPDDIGGIEFGPRAKYDQFGVAGPVSNWVKSGRYTSINGQVLPTFAGARVGEIERWRMIHGGVRDSLNLQFRKLKLG
ncbi:MAG: multicopper oxidase domain-containing protein, partial [Polyangiales bacterium]